MQRQTSPGPLVAVAVARTGPGARLARAEAGLPMRPIVPFTPGGSSDILARAVAKKLGPALDSTGVVDNRASAGGSTGATEAARAEPDGRTLRMGHTGTLAVNPALYPRLGDDPLKRLVPVAWVARVPNVRLVPTASPASTLREFVALAKARSGPAGWPARLAAMAARPASLSNGSSRTPASS